MARPRVLHLYPQAAEDLRAIHEPLYSKIVYRLRLLQNFPAMGRPLSDEYQGWRGTPVGIFRIIYRVTRRGVEVLYIRHCKRELPPPPDQPG